MMDVSFFFAADDCFIFFFLKVKLIICFDFIDFININKKKISLTSLYIEYI